jgi:hypothetical protein
MQYINIGIISLITIMILVWFGHINLILYKDLQEEKKSMGEALKLWIRALFVVVGVSIILVWR